MRTITSWQIAMALALLGTGSGCDPRLRDRDRFTDAALAFPCDKTREQIYAELVQPTCATSGCHDSTTRSAALDLEAPAAIGRMWGQPSTCKQQPLLDDITPFAGYVFEKVGREKPECGGRMPLGRPALTDEQQRCLHVWLSPDAPIEDATVTPTPAPEPIAASATPTSTPTPAATPSPTPTPTPTPTPAPAPNPNPNPTPAPVCPAPAAAAGSLVVYAETNAATWQYGGFDWNRFVPVSTPVCSGAAALQYTATQYDGVLFLASQPVAARHVSLRLFLSRACTLSVAAVAPGADPHSFLGGGPIAFTAGWQEVALDIPLSTATTERLIIENQEAAAVTLTVDDVRLSF